MSPSRKSFAFFFSSSLRMDAAHLLSRKLPEETMQPHTHAHGHYGQQVAAYAHDHYEKGHDRGKCQKRLRKTANKYGTYILIFPY